MNNIIKSLKDLQDAVTMAAPTYSTNMEVARRLGKIIKDVNDKIEYQEEVDYKCKDK